MRKINMLLHHEHMPVLKNKTEGEKVKRWTGKLMRVTPGVYVNEH